MDIRLVLEKEGKRTRIVHLRPPLAVLGRGAGTTLRIPSAEVSRRHCRLTVDDGYVSVEDLGSINGTFVNGEEISALTILYPGDRLEIGPVTFIIEYDLPTVELVADSHDGQNDRVSNGDSATLLQEVEDSELGDNDFVEAATPEEDTKPKIKPSDDDAPIPLADDERLSDHTQLLDENERVGISDSTKLRDLLSGLDDSATVMPPNRKRK